ncbi:MAG: hypothetical protein JWO82_2365 [Akkermansiaceae bacterium]|nr:hypothetical protein [Akkermansiaceae bacterium]
MRRYPLIVLFQLAACTLALAGDGSLADLRSSYQAQLDKIIEANSATMTSLGEQVTSALTRAEEAAKKSNDPSSAALSAEIERWKSEGDLPAEPSQVPAIAKIHQIYRTQKAAKTAERNRLIAAWYRTYDAKLAELGSKAEAVDEVKEEREKIGGSFMVKEALEGAKNQPDPKPSETKPAATTPSAPVAAGPWKDLKKVKWESLDGNDYFKGGMTTWKDPIKFGGKEYKVRDIMYTHGGGSVTYKFPTPITALKGTGCMEERTGQGNVVFIIETDEGEVFRSKPVTKDHTAEPFDLTFKPTTKLVIKSDPNGGAQEDWAFLLKPEYR